MRVLLSTFGSRGDVAPLLSLGSGLLRAGHQVHFAAEPAYASLVQARGLPFVPVGDCHDLPERLRELGLRINRQRRNPLAQLRTAAEYLSGLIEAQFRDSL